MSESPQDIIARLSEYWEYDTDHLTCAARDCIIEQASEIARLRRCLSGLLGFHDGEPMTWVDSKRRIDAARAALAAKP